MLDDGVYVKHKRDAYEGVIDGRTKLKGIFTGNQDVEFQYRIRVHGDDKRKIAPEEDLTIINPPVASFDKKETRFKERSFLMDAGYSLEVEVNARRLILEKVVGEQGLFKVVSFLMRSLMYGRSGSEWPHVFKKSSEPESFLISLTGNDLRTVRYIRALNEWASDVDWLIKNCHDAKDFDEAFVLYEKEKKTLELRGFVWGNKKLP